MPKVLFIAHNFPPITGGVSHVMLTLCQSLAPQDVVVLAPWGTNFKTHASLNVKDRQTAIDVDRKLDFKVYRSRYSARSKVRTALSVLGFLLKTLWLLLCERPALVYFSHPYPTALIGPVVRLLGTPYVVHTHGSELVRPRGRITAALRLVAMQRAFRVVCTSNWTKDYVVKLGVAANKAVVINPKLDLSRFARPVDMEEFVCREGLRGRPVILTVGHICHRKGQHLVIEAMPEVIKEFPDALYVIAGTGPDVDKLKRLAADRGVSQHVVFPGNRDIVPFYHACDVFILPSLYIEKPLGDIESFGIVYIEASACGKAVIGANNGGIPDAVADGESGILIETGSVEAIAAALKRLLADRELRERLGRQGYDRVQRCFTLERLKEELRQLILDPLEQEQHHP